MKESNIMKDPTRHNEDTDLGHHIPNNGTSLTIRSSQPGIRRETSGSPCTPNATGRVTIL